MSGVEFPVRLYRLRLNRWVARLDLPECGDPEGYGEGPGEALRNLADFNTDEWATLTKLADAPAKEAP